MDGPSCSRTTVLGCSCERRYGRATRLNTPKNGWVLVTLMTAGLVVIIWAVAGPALTSLFEQAIQRVSGL